MPYAPCVQRDDMAGLLEDLARSDALILGTPVHMAHVTSLMMTFLERLCWTSPSPRPGPDRHRLSGAAHGRAAQGGDHRGVGGGAAAYRRFCDQATPLLRQTIRDSLNCVTVGRLYAGAWRGGGVDGYLDKALALGRRLGS